MTDEDRERLVRAINEKWPYPTPPDAATIASCIDEYKRVREYLRNPSPLDR